MAPKPRPVTSKSLQHLLTRIGSASTGTKDELHARLRHDIWRQRLPNTRSEWKPRDSQARSQSLRLISIDMGIKNLAYCDAEIKYLAPSQSAVMDVVRWEKIDLNAPRGHVLAPSRSQDAGQGSEEVDQDVDPYSLSVLSQTAYWFVKNVVLSARPDIILIERQRWRSASSAAIQQWTVRVNTLEAMIWAILATVRSEQRSSVRKPTSGIGEEDFEVFGVEPKRVGMFWLERHARTQRGDGDAEQRVEGKKVSKSKAEKKAKIAILRSWLAADRPSTAPSSPASERSIAFTLGVGAVKVREALTAPRASRSRKSPQRGEVVEQADEDVKEAEISKLDDVTDCFLQAAAWVAWESNRVQLAEIWETKRGKDGKLPALDDETLKAMLEEAGQEP